MLVNNPAKRDDVKEKIRQSRIGKKSSLETRAKISEATSGKNNPFYNKTHKPESIEKMREASIGKKQSKEIIQKRMKNMYGDSNPSKRPEVRKKVGKKSKGRFPNKETRRKMSNSAKKRLANPENHPPWKGGLSFEPYCLEWTNDFRYFVFERDDYKCRNPECWKTSDVLCAHHIDYNKKNCEPENIITTCLSCNSRANFNREYWQELY